jgi:hypothetical protein
MRPEALGVSLGLATTIALSVGCGSTGGDVLTPALDGASGSDGSQGGADGARGQDGGGGPGVDGGQGETGADEVGSDATRLDGSNDAGADRGADDGAGGSDGAETAPPEPCGDSGAVCAAPEVCAGAACSCLVACSVGVVQRSDGSLWWYAFSEGAAPVPVRSSDGSLFIASSFSATYEYSACAVRRSDATVWCWDAPGSVCDGGTTCITTTYGDLGNDSTTPSLLPVEVVTTDGKPLANVQTVRLGWDGEESCAVDQTGAAFCWGANIGGALGTGTTTDAHVATPVLTAAGGPQLTGVADVVIDLARACARKTDGTVWCWGQGAPADAGGIAPFPEQVPLSAKALSLSLDEYTTCAVLADTTVWCWGEGYFGASSSPTQMLTSSGDPFTGAVAVTVDETDLHVLKSDGSIWFWGDGSMSTGPLSTVGPNTYTGDTKAFLLCQSNHFFPTFVDTQGVFHDEFDETDAIQVTCP